MISQGKAWHQFLRAASGLWNDKAVVISYPKSGRTWHRILLAKYLELLYELTPRRSISTRSLSRVTGTPAVAYSHNGAGFRYAIGPHHPLNGSPLLWIRRKVVLLVRDPRDVLTSGYFHALDRDQSFNGSLSEYIRHPYTGIDKLVIAHRRWNSFRRLSSSFLLQRYESFHRDAEGSFSQFLDFISVPIDRSAIRTAVEFCSFENLQRLESEGYFGTKAMKLRSGGVRSLKMREGLIGGHTRHMSDDDVSFVQSRIAQLGYPF
jgi:Sulfotransferase domain